MRARKLMNPRCRWSAIVVAGTILGASTAAAQEGDKPDLGDVPTPVLDGLKARFPHADVQKWSKEREGEIVVYDFEFNQDGRKLEADVREDGTLYNWEKAIAAEELPASVREAAGERYPDASIREIMEITAVKDGKEELEGYEIVMETGDNEEVEIMVAADGEILEDSSEEQ